jgi:hypothetical protein
MIYLRKFNENVENIFYLFLEFIEKYDLEEHPNNTNTNNIKTFYNRNLSLDIQNCWVFDQNCWQVTLSFHYNGTHGMTDRNYLTDFYNKGFDGLKDTNMRYILEEITDSCKKYLKSEEVIIGSYGSELNIIFVNNKSTLKKYNGIDLYGSTAVLEFSGGHINSNIIRHRNCFDIYIGNQISGMYAIWGYYDNYFYQVPITIISSSLKKLDEYVSEKWIETCDRLKIKNFQKVGNKPKINVIQFMRELKDIDLTKMPLN